MIKIGKCKEEVFDSGAWHSHQCSHNIWKDKPNDGYCKQHHPDIVKERDKAREERWKKVEEESPIHRLLKANERIKELEVEIDKLKEERR